MKTAITIWQGRIAPVFDVAGCVLVLEGESEQKAQLPVGAVSAKVEWLRGESVDTLVCGAISNEARSMVEAAGIRVLPFLSGDFREVLSACESGLPDVQRFAMPGCRGCRRRRRGNRI